MNKMNKMNKIFADTGWEEKATYIYWRVVIIMEINRNSLNVSDNAGIWKKIPDAFYYTQNYIVSRNSTIFIIHNQAKI